MQVAEKAQVVEATRERPRLVKGTPLPAVRWGGEAVPRSAAQRGAADDGDAVVLPGELVGVVERGGQQGADLVELHGGIEVGVAEPARQYESDASVVHLLVDRKSVV